MERQLQERLIGATVLMIVAVLVVPELLSGPKPAASPPAATVSSDPPSRDLPSSGEPPPALVAAVEEPRDVRPPRDSAPAAMNPSPAQTSPPLAVTPVALAGSASVIAPTATAPPQAVSSPAEAVAPAAPPAKPPSDKRSLEKGGWSVQVGSYAKSAAAQRIAEDLQSHGFAAVVLPVDLQGKRLYRVRAGPPTDRKTADETLRRVQRFMPSSRLVGNP